MDETQSNNKPVKKYHWRNKTEGKEQYVRFKKEFVANLKESRTRTRTSSTPTISTKGMA